MMRRSNSSFSKFIFWLTYAIAVLAAWFHTYAVFARTDEWYIAALSATAIDGVLAYTLHVAGRAATNQRNAALIGTIAFAAISAVAQIIQRLTALGTDMPVWLQMVSMFLVPAATTGSVVVLGIIKYFDRDGNGIPDFLERPSFARPRPVMSAPSIRPGEIHREAALRERETGHRVPRVGFTEDEDDARGVQVGLPKHRMVNPNGRHDSPELFETTGPKPPEVYRPDESQ